MFNKLFCKKINFQKIKNFDKLKSINNTNFDIQFIIDKCRHTHRIEAKIFLLTKQQNSEWIVKVQILINLFTMSCDMLFTVLALIFLTGNFLNKPSNFEIVLFYNLGIPGRDILVS